MMLTLDAAENHVVTIVTEDDLPPYIYLQNGELKGIYIDIINEAQKHLPEKYRIQLEPMPWKRALMQVKNGNAFAVLPPYIRLELRPYISPYSKPLMTETVVAFCHKASGMKELLQLNTHHMRALHIGINAGYLVLSHQYLALKAQGRIKIWENKSTRANTQKLIDGKLDCYINDRHAILHEIAELKKIRPGLNTDNLIEVDELSANTAHIGYSNVKTENYPFRADFIIEMDKALEKALASYRASIKNKTPDKP